MSGTLLGGPGDPDEAASVTPTPGSLQGRNGSLRAVRSRPRTGPHHQYRPTRSHDPEGTRLRQAGHSVLLSDRPQVQSGYRLRTAAGHAPTAGRGRTRSVAVA